MNGKVLATMMFALLPSLALAQSSDQRKSQANQSGNGSGQASAPGKNGNGSDANGATTPDGAQSDAMRPPRRRRSPFSSAVNKEGEPLMNTSEQHRLIDRESSEICESEPAAATAAK